MQPVRQWLSVCAVCRRLRGETGRWEPCEPSLLEAPGVELSHGLCPDCLSSFLPSPHHPETNCLALRQSVHSGTPEEIVTD